MSVVGAVASGILYCDGFNSTALLSVSFRCIVELVFLTIFLIKWLDTSHHEANPIKQAICVLNYARKTKYPRRRSALTYFDEEEPSRPGYGKYKFGGPFSIEKVEDVRTVLHIATHSYAWYAQAGVVTEEW